MLANLKSSAGPKEQSFLNSYYENKFEEFKISELTEENIQKVLQEKGELIDVVID